MLVGSKSQMYDCLLMQNLETWIDMPLADDILKQNSTAGET